MSRNKIALTGPYDGLEEARRACTADLKETSPELYDACNGYTESLIAEVSASGNAVPGSALTDDKDLAVFRQFIKQQHTEYWFADLNGRGSTADLGWDAFRSLVVRYAEHAYLNAFGAYRAATEQLSQIERSRQEVSELLAEIEGRLDGDSAAVIADGEATPQELLTSAKRTVATATRQLDTAQTEISNAHAYHAVGDCYQTEYDIESESFSDVSLADDADWFLQDLRHRRDRLRTRARWMRNDVSALKSRPAVRDSA
uniref:hypothetical protein n=1 Tax=Halobacterium sp. (strain GN101) TaxID=88773 RepID=UPI0020FFFBCF|nr:hypothetical protein [Halobacterium sp. GN101]